MLGTPGEVPGTLVERAKPSERLFPSTEKYEFELPHHRASTTGDPNVSTVNQTLAAAVLGGLLYASSSQAHAAPPVPAVPLPARVATDDKTDLATLKTQIESANTKLADIQKDLKTLTEILKGKKDEKGFPIESDAGLVADMKKLKDTLAALEKELSQLKSQSSSLRPPATGGTGPDIKPVPAKGIVRIVNEYPVQISIVVNGTSYRVAPTKSVDVDVAAGDFTYQLLESGAAPTRSVIKDKETVTLRIK